MCLRVWGGEPLPLACLPAGVGGHWKCGEASHLLDCKPAADFSSSRVSAECSMKYSQGVFMRTCLQVSSVAEFISALDLNVFTASTGEGGGVAATARAGAGRRH